MKTSHIHHLFLLTAIALLMMAMVGSTSAQAPTVTSDKYDDAYEDALDCGSFFVTEYGTTHFQRQRWYDEEGNLLKQITIQQGTGSFTSPVNAVTITTRVGATFTQEWNPETNDYIWTKTGTWTAYAPQEGVVGHDVGIVSIDLSSDEIIFEGGDSPLITAADFWGYVADIFCPILGA